GAEVIDRLIETVLSNAVFEERVGLYPFGSTQESIARGESVDKIMWVQLAASPLHDENGKVNRILLIKRDITEQAENEIRLRHAKEVAETANQTKSEFLANMSHEIRTPMTAILGYADLLEVDSDDPADRERSVDAVRTIRNNANHLLTIINDILDMSKIEAGQMRVETIETSPVQIVEEVVSLVRPRANGKRVDACAVFETRMPRIIQSDPTRLRQILLNLMGNAIKFTEVGSVKLCVGFDSQRRRVNFRVVDTGIGMTPKQCEHVSQFAAFNQADTSMSRRYGGTGLGLRISNALSMMLGGEGISIKSTEGVGSTFSVSISVGAIDRIELVDPAQASADQQVAVSNAEADKSKKFEGKPLDGYRILLAEDGPDNQRLISFHLKKAGADVTVADNGRIACEIIESAGDQVPDVVLMDMQMPELDGYSASRRLRDQGFDKPIIALTAHAMQGDRERCLAAGCDDYLTKPIDRSKLVRTCVAWFGNQSDQASAA
ncbi:MAG: response regulator, partial [Planctomycetota bacterium]